MTTPNNENEPSVRELRIRVIAAAGAKEGDIFDDYLEAFAVAVQSRARAVALEDAAKVAENAADSFGAVNFEENNPAAAAQSVAYSVRALGVSS